jgi:hypothetical protein
MSEPSTKKTTSPPPSRAARVLKVVTDIESIKATTGPLGDDTTATVELLLDRARKPSPDIELLEATTRILKKWDDVVPPGE